jgi:hypothetical protein
MADQLVHHENVFDEFGNEYVLELSEEPDERARGVLKPRYITDPPIRGPTPEPFNPSSIEDPEDSKGRFAQGAYASRVLTGGLREDEEVPEKAQELFGESGLGLQEEMPPKAATSGCMACES